LTSRRIGLGLRRVIGWRHFWSGLRRWRIFAGWTRYRFFRLDSRHRHCFGRWSFWRWRYFVGREFRRRLVRWSFGHIRRGDRLRITGRCGKHLFRGQAEPALACFQLVFYL
jgi:hypothetical protein